MPATPKPIPEQPQARRVSANTLAELIETTPSTIWRWAESGLIPQPTKITPGCTRWNLDEVLAALDRAAQKNAGKIPPSLTEAHKARAAKTATKDAPSVVDAATVEGGEA